MIIYWSYYNNVQNRPTALKIRIMTYKALVLENRWFYKITATACVCVYVCA